MTNTLDEGMEDIAMKDEREQDDAARRLTKTQLEIRARNANLPKHLRRSIDRHRVALGMPPLWGTILERTGRR